MSAVTYSTVQNQLATIFEEDVTWNINRAAVLFNLLPKKTGISRNINFDVRATDSLSTTGETAYSDGADIATYPDDTLSNAALEYMIAQRTLRLSDTAIDAADVTANPLALRDLLGEKMMTTATALIKDINKMVYAGNPAASPAQVASLLDPTSGALLNAGSYAGINRSSTTGWQSVYKGAGGVIRPISFALMYDFITGIYNASGETPTCLVSSKELWDSFAQLHTNLVRIVTDAQTPGGKVSFDAGTQALYFQGIPWYYDVDCPQNKVIALNLNHVSLEFMSMRGKGKQNEGTASYAPYPEAQLGVGPRIDFSVKSLANAGLYNTYSLYCRPQLAVRRPQSCGVLADVA